MIKSKGYAAKSADSLLVPFEFERPDLRPQDVQINILYCGICHSDLHVAKNEWQKTIYPTVPGHEIVGTVSKIGSGVKGFKIGDRVAVGCMIDSCRECDSCKDDLQQYCEKGFTLTYNSLYEGKVTYGGYANNIAVNEDFVLKLPESLAIEKAGPLLCAGITTYSPLRHWKIGKGHRVGIVGLGGLGHMAVKIAHALGAEVTMITTSPHKAPDAKQLGADKVLLSTDQAAMQKHQMYFDFILNTIPRDHDVNPYMSLLKRDGTLVIVGAIEPLSKPLDARAFIFKRRNFTGSLIGGIKETQELLDFCAKHQILPDVEIIPIQKINEAFERLLKNDVKYRFVIDMGSLS